MRVERVSTHFRGMPMTATSCPAEILHSLMPFDILDMFDTWPVEPRSSMFVTRLQDGQSPGGLPDTQTGTNWNFFRAQTLDWLVPFTTHAQQLTK